MFIKFNSISGLCFLRLEDIKSFKFVNNSLKITCRDGEIRNFILPEGQEDVICKQIDHLDNNH